MRVAAGEIPMPTQGQVLWLGVTRLGDTLCISLASFSQASDGCYFWDAETSLDQEASGECNNLQTAVRQGGFDLVARAGIIHLSDFCECV